MALSFAEIQAAVVQAVSTPTPWWLTLLTGGGLSALALWTGKRIIGAFDALVGKVEGFQSILASHEREDAQRFSAIESQAHGRHEHLMGALQRHADAVAAPLAHVQLEIAQAEVRIEGLENEERRHITRRKGKP